MANISLLEALEVPTGSPIEDKPALTPDIIPQSATMLPSVDHSDEAPPTIVGEQKAVSGSEETFLPPGVLKEDAMKALRRFASDPANKPDQIQAANDALTGLDAEIENFPVGSTDRPHKIKESLGKLMKIFKILGIAIVGLLTMGMFKAIKGGKQ